MSEFKKIQDLLTTENPTKAVVLDDNNELKLADYAGGGQDGLMIDVEVSDDFTNILSITPSFGEIIEAVESGEKVIARMHQEYIEDSETENEYFYTNSIIYTKYTNEDKGDNDGRLSIEFDSPKTPKDPAPYLYTISMIGEDNTLVESTISKLKNIPLSKVDVGSLLQYKEKDGQAYWRDTTINDILSTPYTVGKVLTSTGNNQMEWQDSSAGTAYIDITIISDTEFTASYKGQPATTDTIIGLVNNNFTVIAKVETEENFYQFTPLASIDIGVDNSKSSCSFSTVILFGDGPVLLVATITSDDGSTGSISTTPI